MLIFLSLKYSVNFDLIQNILIGMKPDEPANLILFKTSFKDKKIYNKGFF